MLQDDSAWPRLEVAVDIHTRLCGGDPVAPSDLASAYLDLLANWLTRTHPHLDPHLCDQAAEDAILSLIKNPQSFNPNKSPLDAYLRMSAKADLRNAQDRERRHSKRRENLEVVELFGSGGNLNQEDGDPALIVELAENDRDALGRLIPPDIQRSLTGDEQRVLELMLQGERRTSAFAQALDMMNLPEHSQRIAVKRIKDRIKRRIQRVGGKA